jgi:hypothetical protein
MNDVTASWLPGEGLTGPVGADAGQAEPEPATGRCNARRSEPGTA